MIVYLLGRRRIIIPWGVEWSETMRRRHHRNEYCVPLLIPGRGFWVQAEKHKYYTGILTIANGAKMGIAGANGKRSKLNDVVPDIPNGLRERNEAGELLNTQTVIFANGLVSFNVSLSLCFH
ncbi:hypothetical protein XELAEV_18030421mg [Xenopus laevis]|uniref:Uncharacterized protein n=1 Tax=Xenopus laevis TaxID=8355 RepID=A0A974HET1_XENLA|nr:hypothetical protein XELAEV_18030421mg [Xenopus laevis]